MSAQDIHKRLQATIDILSNSSIISKEKLDAIITLVGGIDPRLDKTLQECSKALNHIEKLQQNDFISLSAEALPERTEEQKKRKKAVIFLINNLQDLKSEIQRIQKELGTINNKTTSSTQKTIGAAKIMHFAKGPFGLVTIAAVLLVCTAAFVKNSNPKYAASQSTVKGIIVDGKKIPLSVIYVGNGPDCGSPHYHALNHVSVKTADGTYAFDPGGCGFGKVKDVAVAEF